MKAELDPSNGIMLGVGLDNDGHTRTTKGENFYLVGGSEETHERMTETAIKINEKLSAKGKHLSEISGRELKDIIQEINGK
ncbi:MAG: hypothetical protein MST10_08585 [Lentisphaeria bacterium]|nr:hypothetical protein [Lentisphaeria bacterium]